MSGARTHGTTALRVAVALLVATYPVALVTRNPMPAALGTAALVALVLARLRFQHAVAAVTPSVLRIVEPASVRVGETAIVRLVADGAHVPGATVSLDDTPPPGLHAVSWPHGRDARFVYTVRAEGRGRHDWSAARIRWTDASGLWVHERSVAAPAALEVEAAPDATGPGRRAGTRLNASRMDPLGILREELEILGIRPFQPGDRGRDIDWKRLSREQGMLSRDYERQARPTLWVLADGSWTMRARLGGPSKFDHATALAAQLLEAAQAQGLQTAFAVYDAHDVLAREDPTSTGGVAVRFRTALAALAPAREATRRPPVGAMAGVASDFAAALRVLQGRPPHSGIRQALRRTASEKRPILLLLTDAHGAGKDLVDGARRAAQQGARVHVALLADDDYLAAPLAPDAADLVAAAREERRLAHVQQLLGQGGVRTIEVLPSDTARLLVRATSGGPA